MTEKNTKMGIRGAPGISIDLWHPSPKAFDPVHTARTLSHINRFAGNYGTYSVAQHAFMVSRLVGSLGGTVNEQLSALHHDDAEMVTNDIPSPVKSLAPGLIDLEKRLNRAIDMRYGIDVCAPIVKRADRLILGAEIAMIVPAHDRWIYAEALAEISQDEKYGKILYKYADFIPWDPDVAAARYIDLHNVLFRAETDEWIRMAQENANPDAETNN